MVSKTPRLFSNSQDIKDRLGCSPKASLTPKMMRRLDISDNARSTTL